MNIEKEQNKIHINYQVITQIIDKGAKVLDLGCGDGSLLEKLIKEKQVSGTVLKKQL